MEFLSLFLLILSVLSHIGMSLFLAKPKFSKPVKSSSCQQWADTGTCRRVFRT